MTDETRELTEGVRELRKTFGDTQHRFANRFPGGLSISSVHRYETTAAPEGLILFKLSTLAREAGREDLASLFLRAWERTAYAGKSEWSKALITLRTHLGETQAAFAKRIGVSEITISRWETGVIPNQPVLELLATLADEAGLAETANIFRELVRLAQQVISDQARQFFVNEVLTDLVTAIPPRTDYDRLGHLVYGLVQQFRQDLTMKLTGEEQEALGRGLVSFIGDFFGLGKATSFTSDRERHYLLKGAKLPPVGVKVSGPVSVLAQKIANELKDIPAQEREQLIAYLWEREKTNGDTKPVQ